MYRNVIEELLRWHESPGRKPLVLKGARQVGKTYILNEFGRRYFKEKGKQYHYIDFRKEKELYSVFSETTDPKEIIRLLQFSLKRKIDINHDLLVFDEIQECPGAVTSFKYFYEEMNNLSVIGAGSHLGMTKSEESFPVGKVNFVHMYPMTFSEFVCAVDQSAYNEFLNFNLNNSIRVNTIIHNRFLELLRCYFVTGGLPEVVNNFIHHGKDNELLGLLSARNRQEELIEGYKADFSKYSGTVNANHIHSVFESVPIQLSRAHDSEVDKFKFNNIIPNQKGFARIKNPLDWLIRSKLCIKTLIAKKSIHPLKSYCEDNRFKVFIFDTGILNCMLSIPPETIMSNGLGSYKGFIAENFVAQELYSCINDDLISWSEGQSEIEFLVNIGSDIVPLEVKSSQKSKRAKSLDSYINKYSPAKAYKLSNQNFSDNSQRGFLTVPVYFCSKIFKS